MLIKYHVNDKCKAAKRSNHLKIQFIHFYIKKLAELKS